MNCHQMTDDLMRDLIFFVVDTELPLLEFNYYILAAFVRKLKWAHNIILLIDHPQAPESIKL